MFLLPLLLASLLAFADATPAYAEPLLEEDGYALEAGLTQSGVYDSNPLLIAHGAQAIVGSTTSPWLKLAKETPTEAFSLRTQVDQSLFDRTAYNSTDLHTDGVLSRKNERWSAALTAGADYDTTRTNDLTSLGLNVGSIRQFTYNLGADVSFTPTTLDKIALSTQYQRTTYDSGYYTNYSVITLTPSYTRALTALTSAIVNVQAQRYLSDRDPQNTTDSLGPSFGFVTRLTPDFTLNASGGGQVSREHISRQPDDKWTWHDIFTASLTYKDELTSMALKSSRARQPWGNGLSSIVTSFGIDLEHKITPHFGLTSSGEYRYADYDHTPGPSNMDSLTTGKGGVFYRLTEDLKLASTYTYQKRRFTSDGGQADRHTAYLNLVYTP